MRAVKPFRRLEPSGPDPDFDEDEQSLLADEDDEDAVRVVCPACSRPIALAGDDEALPPHGVCPTPWDPFGVTLCPGSGRAAPEGVVPMPVLRAAGESPVPSVLPEGLHWRFQPFSHVSGPGVRPASAPELRRAA
jgi:hypothetical protein